MHPEGNLSLGLQTRCYARAMVWTPAFITRFFEELRFPHLLLLTAGLFVVDLLVPDAIPMIDEILLGLATLLIAQIRKRRSTPDASTP